MQRGRKLRKPPVRKPKIQEDEAPIITLTKPVQEEIEIEVFERIEKVYEVEPAIPEPTEKEKEYDALVEYYLIHNNFSGYKIQYHDKLEVLALERQLLLPRIKAIIAKLFKRTSAEHSELAELLYCYNTYFKRSDSFTCSACVARAYEALKKLV